MLYAVNEDNEKIKATKNVFGFCPGCGIKLVPKCGLIKIHHWAHSSKESCNWHKPKTDWHYAWQDTFSKDKVEVRITKGDHYKVADVYSKEVVIEFQNSPISPEEIKLRENFYGEKMLWVVNGMKFLKNISFEARSDLDRLKPILHIEWKYPKKNFSFSNRPVFYDFGGDSLVRIIEKSDCNKHLKAELVLKYNFLKHYKGVVESLETILFDNKNLGCYKEYYEIKIKGEEALLAEQNKKNILMERQIQRKQKRDQITSSGMRLIKVIVHGNDYNYKNDTFTYIQRIGCPQLNKDISLNICESCSKFEGKELLNHSNPDETFYIYCSYDE